MIKIKPWLGTVRSSWLGSVRQFSSIIKSVNDPSLPQPSDGISVVVKAFYIARGINFNRLKLNSLFKHFKQNKQSKSVTLTVDEDSNQYLSIFNYGSVVLFNIPEDKQVEYIKELTSTAVAHIASKPQYSDSYKIIVHSNLDKPSVIKAEHVNIKRLDTNNITIISTVMAQTVALDYYASTVEEMLEVFMKMNMKIEETGNFRNLSANGLYKLVAANNTIITNVLSKLGIFEGTDAAWDNADYYDTWEALRRDFELDYRFKDLSLKINIIKEDSRFFSEVLHNAQSTKLEIYIIVLIAAELVIGLCGLCDINLHSILEFLNTL